ncbi:MAG: quinol:cytochrome C oxidoreductase [Bacteroidia bacterium]
MSHGHEIHIQQENYQFKGKAKTLSLGLLVVGLVFTIIGIFSAYNSDSTDTHHAAATSQEHHEAPATAEHADASHGDAHASDVHEANAYPGQNILGVDIGHSDPALYPIVQEHAKPWYTRVYLNLLLNGYYILLVSICALFFFALQYAANAGWATVILRVPLAMSTIIPVGAIILIAVFLIDGSNIYHWVHYEHLHLKKGDVGFDKILDDKSWFLNTKLALGFLIAIPIIWMLFLRKMRSMAFREDLDGGTGFFNKQIRYSAAFIFIFAFSLSIMSWVVNMSVDAHWYSTMFSVYNFATGWVSAIAVILLIVLYLKRNGYLELVTEEHTHDLAKLMFAFSIFWTYLWLSQFLLIWYANIPEESVYFYQRWEAPFIAQFLMNLVLNFLIPFLVLMTRDNKRNPKIVTWVAILILIGHWNDLHLMLMPGPLNTQAGIGFLEIGMTMAFAGLFMYWIFTALSKRGLVSVKHPYLEESAHHDVGV